MRIHLRGTLCAVSALLTAIVGSALVLPDVEAQTPPAPQPAAKFSFVLKDRHGHATPARTKAAHTGGGNTDVAQPREDTLIITMTGVATAGPYPTHGSSAVVDFDLNQAFTIVASDPKLPKANLSVEAQVIGLLRGDKHGGSASVGNGAVMVHCGHVSVLSLCIDGHSVAGEDNLAINDHKGPVSVAVLPGDFHLAQTFRITAQHARGVCGKAAAAEFAPDPALDPTWISVTEPFHGANKKEFGFRVTLRLEPQ